MLHTTSSDPALGPTDQGFRTRWWTTWRHPSHRVVSCSSVGASALGSLPPPPFAYGTAESFQPAQSDTHSVPRGLRMGMEDRRRATAHPQPMTPTTAGEPPTQSDFLSLSLTAFPKRDGLCFQQRPLTRVTIMPHARIHAKLPHPTPLRMAACCFATGSGSITTKVGEVEPHPSAERSGLGSGIQVVFPLASLLCCQIEKNYHAGRKTDTGGIVMYSLLSTKAEGMLLAPGLVRLAIDGILGP